MCYLAIFYGDATAMTLNHFKLELNVNGLGISALARRDIFQCSTALTLVDMFSMVVKPFRNGRER